MARVLVFGNSGSGKSTLAKLLSDSFGMEHLDLDTLAWLAGQPPQRRPLADSEMLIKNFAQGNESWVIEGCYADLLRLAADEAGEIAFLNLPVKDCVENARSRPFEPHKYSSEAAQNQNLAMLIRWIEDYPDRDDSCSLSAHRKFFDAFPGRKSVLTSRTETSLFRPA
ncbi:MAG: shikimate kinase [Gammaproteobacteria bacterium]|nr:shikimate kinase [Gammaproteobacteria bacterium]